MLLIKNPAGANEAVRTLLDGSPPRLAVVALNDEIADGRDVSWIWDVDFEPLLAGLERVVVSGDRAAELALRFAYGGLDARPDRGRARRSRRRSTAGSSSTAAGGELVVLPTYTAMLGAARHRRRPRARVRLLGAAAVRIRVGHLYPELPQHLRRPRQHRRALGARARRAATSSRSSPIGLGDAAAGRRSTSSTSAAARIASRSSSRPTSPRKRAALHDGGRGRRGVPRRLRRLPAARPLLPRPARASSCPGIGLLPLHTVAGERRMIGDVLLDCAWAGETLAGFENHAGRTILDDGAEPLGRVVAGFGNDGVTGFEGCRAGRVYGDVPARAAAAAQPVVRRPAARGCARAPRPAPSVELAPLDDTLEQQAHALPPSAPAAAAAARG